MKLVKNYLSIILTLLWFSSCAQVGIKNQKIISTTNQLINYLENCDSTGVLNLLDSAFAHTNEPNFRIYIKESFLKDCSLFNEIVDKHELPDINGIIFKKDSSQLPPANIAILPIISKDDTILNIKKCFLMLAFYPDEFFALNSHLLKYHIVIERLKADNTDKVKMPDWLKKINEN